MVMNIISRMIQPQQVSITPQIQASSSNNPFANPFIANKNQDSNTYAKNQPVFGGYFAGYYNGQPNIVGRRLFLEV